MLQSQKYCTLLQDKGYAMIDSIFEVFKECACVIDTMLKNPSTKYLSSQNSSGDTQLEVDVEADKLIEKKLLALDCIKAVCSEEKQEIVHKDPLKQAIEANANASLDSITLGKSKSTNGTAHLSVAYDPLDGSSLIDSNLSVGSIFGIYDGCLCASGLVASGYILYGPRLEAVFAKDKVVHYRHNGKIWEKLGELKLQNKGKINAPGGTQQHWSEKHRALIASLFSQGYRLRYSGGMVPDLHQILIKGGGLFSYPATNDAPKGKLRKLFEVFPFAFIYEKAGGEALTATDNGGTKRILELEVEHIHDTTACFLGSKEEIAQVKQTYNNKEW